MSPRERKLLNPRSRDLSTRFAIHLRELLDRRKLTSGEFLERLGNVGLSVARQTVMKWLSGDRLPRPQDLEAIARVLSVRDYRHVLPPPI